MNLGPVDSQHITRDVILHYFRTNHPLLLLILNQALIPMTSCGTVWYDNLVIPEALDLIQ